MHQMMNMIVSSPEREHHNKILRYYEDIVLTYSLTDKISKKKKESVRKE